jgi:sulfite exporter TauE/SafE
MLIAAFILGFFNSLHCLGMCGPLHLAAGIHAQQPNAWLMAITYHGGRLLTYATLGILFGLLGFGLKLAGIQQYLSIISGIIIIIVAITGFKRIETFLYVPFKQTIGGILPKLYGKNGLLLKFGAGIINGLLPCGLVYMALVGSLAMQHAWQGGLFMIIFGAGTLSVFVLLTMLPKPLSNRPSFRMATLIAGLILGTLLILRGMDLGIPYVSPVINQTQEIDPNCAPNH